MEDQLLKTNQKERSENRVLELFRSFFKIITTLFLENATYF